MNKKSIAPNLVVRLGLLFVLVASLVGCAGESQDPSIGYGPNPVLPTPEQALIPVLKAPNAIGWDDGEAPVAGDGMKVTAFASGLDHPRWVYVLPNGDVLVAETNAPERPDDAKGIKGFFFKLFQKKAGGGVPSANRIMLLRDADGDGSAEFRSVFLEGVNSPFGMALVGNTF